MNGMVCRYHTHMEDSAFLSHDVVTELCRRSHMQARGREETMANQKIRQHDINDYYFYTKILFKLISKEIRRNYRTTNNLFTQIVSSNQINLDGSKRKQHGRSENGKQHCKNCNPTGNVNLGEPNIETSFPSVDTGEVFLS